MDIIWESTMDSKYDVKVIGDGDYKGKLQIYEGEKLLMEEPVGLAYGAIFGPDIDDVAQWQERAIEFVDKINE